MIPAMYSGRLLRTSGIFSLVRFRLFHVVAVVWNSSDPLSLFEASRPIASGIKNDELQLEARREAYAILLTDRKIRCF